MASEDYFALVGSQSLLGREIRDIAAATGATLRSFDTADDQGEEFEVSLPLDAASIAGAKAVLFAGDEAAAKQVLSMSPRHVIDLTGTLEAPSGMRLTKIPSAATLMLKLAFTRLGAMSPVARSVVNLFVPASEWGAKALQELQQQTTSLLSFQQLQKEVFDTQAAFAMLPEFGEESKLMLKAPSDLGLPYLSLRVSHAPVFHGMTASIWLEFEKEVNWSVLEKSLDPTPDNVSIAGDDEVRIGGFERDASSPNAAWFWAVADNHRLVARAALAVAEAI
jgi:aspartate-semialdehyde dehydrogenase